jgi:hypothetical protein
LFLPEFCCFDYRTNLPGKLASWAKNSRGRLRILDLIVVIRRFRSLTAVSLIAMFRQSGAVIALPECSEKQNKEVRSVASHQRWPQDLRQLNAT